MKSHLHIISGAPGTYINILDYRSPKDLADYLRYLSDNETAYLEYYKNRPPWVGRNMFRPGFCDLCALIHNTTYTRTYPDIQDWWETGVCDNNIVHKLINGTDVH